jgi:hypothetical protein
LVRRRADFTHLNPGGHFGLPSHKWFWFNRAGEGDSPHGVPGLWSEGVQISRISIRVDISVSPLTNGFGLTVQEKEIARMVCLAFGQKVCGFDLLRSERGKSYVCDVNGWSFVKNSHKVRLCLLRCMNE